MPMIPSPPSVERSADAPPDASLLAEILGVAGAVRRRWAWVALATAAALAAAVLFLMAVTPRYLATAQLLIDPRAKRIVEGAVVPGGFGSSAAGADTLLVDSQVELIQSNTVLKKIVESERLPEIGIYPPARPGAGIADSPTFADHIAAVDDASATAYPGYREVIDQILAKLPRAGGAPGKPTICLLVGTEAAAGTSSTALALTYRSAINGRRTLLIDACASDPHLSQVFAANLKQRRACVLDSEAHLAEITLQDARTGLSMLPIALADLARFDGEQQRRLLAGLRQLTQRFELVVIDTGAAADNQAMAFLAAIADQVLIVTQQSSASSGLSRLRAMEAARRFPARGAASIVETAAA